MVVLTAIYVLATILICYYNYGATKASRDQAAEMRRQYEEDNRPYITVEFIYERKAFYGLRFSNHGKRLANHVRIQLDQTFLDSLKEPSFSEMLKRATAKNVLLELGNIMISTSAQTNSVKTQTNILFRGKWSTKMVSVHTKKRLTLILTPMQHSFP